MVTPELAMNPGSSQPTKRIQISAEEDPMRPFGSYS